MKAGHGLCSRHRVGFYRKLPWLEGMRFGLGEFTTVFLEHQAQSMSEYKHVSPGACIYFYD